MKFWKISSKTLNYVLEGWRANPLRSTEYGVRSMELNMLLKETPAIMMFLSNTVHITGEFAFTLLGFFKTLYKSRHYCE